MKKRLISFILVCTFVLSMIPASISVSAATTTAAQDGYSVVKGNEGDKVTKDTDGTYLVTRNGTADTVVKKGNATLDEGWIKLDMPVGSAYQIRKRQGIVFGASDLANLGTGTHYFAYIDGRGDSTNPYVCLAKVTDGTLTTLYNAEDQYRLNNILSAREVWEMDSIELSVYFTKDGVIKIFIEDICVYQTTGQTVSGNKYGIMITKTVNGTSEQNATGSYAFNSLTTKGFDDYNLVYGGWDMTAEGITSALNFDENAIDDRSFWIANDTVSGTESVYRFSIKNYTTAYSGTVNSSTGQPDSATQSGIVFGAVCPDNASFYNSNSIAYYMFYLNYRADKPEDSAFGIAICDKKGFSTAEKANTWTQLTSVNAKNIEGRYSDGTDEDNYSDWLTAGKDINGYIYYNAVTGEIRVSFDNGRKIISYTESAENLAKRTNGNGKQYGVRANAVGVTIDVEAYDVVSHSKNGFRTGMGDWVYLEDGTAIATKDNSNVYSNTTVSGNDIWYHFSATDYGYTDTGFIMGADITNDGVWEYKNGAQVNAGYSFFIYENGNFTIGRYGVIFDSNNDNVDDKWWYSLSRSGTASVNGTTYWMKDKDSVQSEDPGVYDVRIHQVYKDGVNTFDVYIGGIYKCTYTDSTDKALDPNGSTYGWRSIAGSTLAVHTAEIVEYPDWLDTKVKNTALGDFNTQRAIDYDSKTGFFNSALVGDTNFIMSEQSVEQATSGKKTVYYAVDMQKMKYGMNADDGFVFGASFSDANYGNTGTWYCLVLGDQRDNNSYTNRAFRLLKYTGQVEVSGKNAGKVNAFPEVVNGFSTDKTSKIAGFDYTPGDILNIKVAVEYDLDNGVTTINAYANGVHVFQFVDTEASEGKNDALPTVGAAALTGTYAGVRTEAGSTSFANIKVSLEDIEYVPNTPAPDTGDSTALWVSLVSIVALAASAVVITKKRTKA